MGMLYVSILCTTLHKPVNQKTATQREATMLPPCYHGNCIMACVHGQLMYVYIYVCVSAGVAEQFAIAEAKLRAWSSVDGEESNDDSYDEDFLPATEPSTQSTGEHTYTVHTHKHSTKRERERESGRETAKSHVLIYMQLYNFFLLRLSILPLFLSSFVPVP